MEKLPVEIAFEIFYRLPPESVIRCKFVCKSWFNLLPSIGDSNNFANKHLLRHRHQRNNLENSTLNFISLQRKSRSDKDADDHHDQEEVGRSGGEFHITEYDEEKLNYKVKTIKFPDHISINGECFWDSIDPKLAGSCNGLLCLPRIYDPNSNLLVKDRIWICNPLLNEYVPLPLSNLQYNKYGSMDTSTGNMVVGFGHNPSTDEYKVVRVYYSDSNSNVGEVEVYTLGKGSMWRSKGTIKYRLMSWSRPVLINGSLHWLSENKSYINIDDFDSNYYMDLLLNPPLQIVSFNFEVEEFNVITAVPQVPNVHYYRTMSELKELGGCLCLIHKGVKLMDIWVCKEYYNMNNNNNKEYSWVQEFSIKWRKGKRQGYCYSPCAIIKKKKKTRRNGGDNDLVLMWCERKELVYYDSKRQNLEYVVRGSRRQILDQSMLPLVVHDDPILHINSVISLKALGEDVKLYPEQNHRKRKAAAYQDMEIKTRPIGCGFPRCHRCMHFQKHKIGNPKKNQK